MPKSANAGYNTDMNEEKEIVRNEFPPIYDECSKVLILGSLPSVASRSEGFYYMNPRNRFWQVISALFGEDLTSMTIPEKREALLRHRVALSDVILSCEIHRSSDASIGKVEYTDVAEIFSHSAVERILLNGQKAYDLFSRRYPEYASIATRLPSTSPANARSSLDDLIKEWGDLLLPIL